MGQTLSRAGFENVPCPFCGLLCDDLRVERRGTGLKVTANGCDKAIAGFERALPDVSAQISGRDVSIEEALGAAAELIRKSRSPLYGGLATDVGGIRAVLSLADRTGGTVDHALSEAVLRNMKVLQSAGWITSTLTEARNRSDVVVIVGSDVQRLSPRFFERVVCAPTAMFEEAAQPRTVIFIGEGLDQSGATGTRVGELVTLPCPPNRVYDVLSVLLARLREHPVSVGEVGGVPLAEIEAVGECLKEAEYGLLVWAPGALPADDAELSVHAICEIVEVLNKTTRCAGLSLGGDEGANTATSVCGWQSGFPTRVSYVSGAPDYDPFVNSIARRLADGEGDLLVWVASISPHLAPPNSKVPTIVLGTPGLECAVPPEVFIPVGTPGLDHSGQLIRCDNVVSLQLRDLGRAPHRSVASVIAAIEAAI
jgi:formylmethanofuran dehydrogenase subunit B